MIYLFTVACTDRESAGIWSKLLASDRSYCFDRLTCLLEPEEAHAARYAWLERLTAGADDDTARRHRVLRGFPAYFERLWQEGRFGPHHVGNADDLVLPLLEGLWLLWPDMRFLFADRNGVTAVASEMRSTGAPFDAACRAWRDRAEESLRLRRHLGARGATVLEARNEDVLEGGRALRQVWTALPGEWDRYAAVKETDAKALAARLGSPDSEWATWPEADRRAFADICGPVQHELGYRLPGASRLRIKRGPSR